MIGFCFAVSDFLFFTKIEKFSHTQTDQTDRQTEPQPHHKKMKEESVAFSQNNEQRTEHKNKIFRFNLGNEMVDALLQFSKMHQHDDRHSYADAWKQWKSDPRISKIIADEVARLQNLDFKGSVESIETKIFKSGRYYFRNKSFIKVPPKPRGKYVSVSKELIHAMNEYIIRQRQTQQATSQFSPSPPAELFNEFCKTYVDILKVEIYRFVSLDEFSENPTLILSKIKKTFKNRVFQLKKL